MLRARARLAACVLATLLLLPAPARPADAAPAPPELTVANALDQGEVHGYQVRTSGGNLAVVARQPAHGLLLEVRQGLGAQVLARQAVPAGGEATFTVPQLPAGEYAVVVGLMGREAAGRYRLTIRAPGLRGQDGVPRVHEPGAGPGWFRASGTRTWSLEQPAGDGPVLAPTEVALTVNGQERARAGSLPARFTLDTTTLGEGLHQVTFAAGTGGGNWAGQARQMLVDNAGAFPDVPPAHWARAEVELLADLRLASGYPDGTFQPGQPVTRAEFTKFLATALGLDAVLPEQPSFADVPAGAWFHRHAEAARAAGVVNGSPGPAGGLVFRPGDRITRAEAATMVVRAAGLAGAAAARASEPLPFSDGARVPDWARGAVAVARDRGLVSGYPDGRFGPADPLNRAQAAALVARLVS